MRHIVWYVVFSLIVGAVLAATLPFLVPWYAAIAFVGGLMLLGDLARGRGPGRYFLTPRVLDEYMQGRAVEHEEASARIAAARQEPWVADAVVDMDEVAKRIEVEEGFIGHPGILVPNPYFVLPLPKLVTWGFATPVEIREAVRWADSPTPPVRWQNPGLRKRLNQMGWSDSEAYARLGLFFWHTDGPIPDPPTASTEADMRRQNRVYDVPRPASLGRASGNWGRQDGGNAESRALFGPNGVQVVGLLDILERCTTENWKALLGAHARAQGESPGEQADRAKRVSLLVERAGGRGVVSGTLTQSQVAEAKRRAEEIPRKGSALVIADPVLRAARPPAQFEAYTAEMLRSFANAAATLLVARPFFGEGEFEELWAPYARVLPLSLLPSG
jgi:hypothetical protein